LSSRIILLYKAYRKPLSLTAMGEGVHE